MTAPSYLEIAEDTYCIETGLYRPGTRRLLPGALG